MCQGNKVKYDNYFKSDIESRLVWIIFASYADVMYFINYQFTYNVTICNIPVIYKIRSLQT